MDIIIRPIEWISIAVSEDKVAGYARIFGKPVPRRLGRWGVTRARVGEGTTHAARAAAVAAAAAATAAPRRR